MSDEENYIVLAMEKILQIILGSEIFPLLYELSDITKL